MFDSITQVLIFDDVPKEVEGLIEFLNSQDVATTFYTPSDLTQKGTLKYRKLIFSDLHIDTNASVQELSKHLVMFRKILEKNIGKDYGSYGLVFFTAYSGDIDDAKKKIIQTHDKYTPPVFIVGLDKNKYFKEGKWNELISDINEKLESEIAAKFFFNWDDTITKAKNSVIKSIFSLCPDYEKQNQNLPFILANLGLNNVGIEDAKEVTTDGLHHEIAGALASLIHHEIKISNTGNVISDVPNIKYTQLKAPKEQDYELKKNLNGEYFKNDELLTKNQESQQIIYVDKENNTIRVEDVNKEIHDIYSSLNTKMFLDFSTVHSDHILPGNVYKLIGDTTWLKTFKFPEKKTIICLEITPPCDFSNKNKVSSRVLFGFVTSYNKSQVNNYNKEYYYKGLYPVQIDKDQNQMIVFDFRTLSLVDDNEIRDSSKYVPFFKAKDKLFADILQKFSSHSARLGLSILHP